MIKIFDTTLRDGEQSPGFSMKLEEKLLMARQLERLGVDVIEAGFAAASAEDFESVQKIGEMCPNTEICGLARCHKGDIEKTIQALHKANKPRIHVFIATSDIHLEYKLKITREEAIKKAVESIKMAKEFTDMVDFSPEDATRSDYDFLVTILTEAIKAGADTINIPDTVGYSTPEDYGKLIKFLIDNVPGMDNVIVATHCHNDLGLAVSNSLAGVKNGARQIECTINGIGERAGNAALEEVVMALKTRPDIFPVADQINTQELLKTSRLLTQITGQYVQPNKAIVGKNAFAHEAGIHQHGILSNRLTYEIMKPEDVGYSANKMVLGKHSGRNAIQDRLKYLGIEVDSEKLQEILKKFKALADKKKKIYDEDLIMIVMDFDGDKHYQLINTKVVSQKNKHGKAVATIKIGDEELDATGAGDGPVDALYSAILQASELKGELIGFKINAITQEKDAIGRVDIKWQDAKGRIWHGHGSNTDIIVAAGLALIDVLNRIYILDNYSQEK